MQNLSAHALRGAVVGKATSDPAFLSELRKDPVKAIEAQFGKQPYGIHVVFEEPGDLVFLIPQKTEQLTKVIDRAVADIGDRTPTKGQFDAKLLQKVWTDSAFLARFRNDPRAILDAEARAHGVTVPADRPVRLYEEQPDECFIVIPSFAGEQLTEAELESVAGGEWGVALVGIIVGVVATEYFCK